MCKLNPSLDSLFLSHARHYRRCCISSSYSTGSTRYTRDHTIEDAKKKKQPIHDIMRITDGWIISDAVEIKLICASSSFSRWHRLVTTVLRWMLNHRFRIAAVNLFEQLAAVAQIDTQIGQ